MAHFDAPLLNIEGTSIFNGLSPGNETDSRIINRRGISLSLIPELISPSVRSNAGEERKKGAQTKGNKESITSETEAGMMNKETSRKEGEQNVRAEANGWNSC